ncbi:MAG: TIGR04211 family SH3 domain-containing protein [Pseudomonadales bacterium]|nr:TIGR04211 family SH3 domain-containing protein [Pseudomonadales bacterium]MDP4640493.1 TIGR04211 family SH3 domain-containing protein [Pseudomonadales bacterium]MDP4766772.1 TIGR04211 family SH3 domain-containing protein [Pseudomonadales bacterium]MDP4874675.1 TIGR04211 family SH3 domain-containing protein [Pseudomonadales bacterium]MDP4910862.1 TIGR04211 family SH3 domain-containing protein [Pseudomonadales bacterium]
MAATVYVRDTIYVPLRSGQSTEHRILQKGIRSGTPLERLEENPNSGYSRVRMADGMEGWIQTQYLVDSPIAADQLVQANARLAKLEASEQARSRQLAAMAEERDALAASEAEFRAQHQALQTDLERINQLAANTVSIDTQNRALQAERLALQQQIDELLQAHAALADNRDQAWFLRGAGTVLLSLLLGFIAARRHYLRRASGGWA